MSEHKWRPLPGTAWALGNDRPGSVGAVILRRPDRTYRVVVGYNMSAFRADADRIADAVFDTLEEAQNFGMLVFKQYI
jgi:hypothetical protein